VPKERQAVRPQRDVPPPDSRQLLTRVARRTTTGRGVSRETWDRATRFEHGARKLAPTATHQIHKQPTGPAMLSSMCRLVLDNAAGRFVRPARPAESRHTATAQVRIGACRPGRRSCSSGTGQRVCPASGVSAVLLKSPRRAEQRHLRHRLSAGGEPPLASDRTGRRCRQDRAQQRACPASEPNGSVRAVTIRPPST